MPRRVAHGGDVTLARAEADRLVDARGVVVLVGAHDQRLDAPRPERPPRHLVDERAADAAPPELLDRSDVLEARHPALAEEAQIAGQPASQIGPVPAAAPLPREPPAHG